MDIKSLCDCFYNGKLNNAIFDGCSVFIEDEKEDDFFTNIKINKKINIVTQNINKKHLENNNIIKWFCLKNTPTFYHPKLYYIPNNFNIPKKTQKKYENFCIISGKKTFNLEKLNFVHTIKNKISYEHYLEHISNYGYIIVTYGDGRDSKKIWESILLGTTPIALKTSLNPIYECLPILVLESWDELDIKVLEGETFGKGLDENYWRKCLTNRDDIFSGNEDEKGDDKKERKIVVENIDNNWRRKIKNGMDLENVYYTTLYYCLINLGKVTNEFRSILFNYEKKNGFKSDDLARYVNLLKFMFKNNYKFVVLKNGFYKMKYKIHLFIIRKKGMRKDIVENILNEIKSNLTILDKILININNKKKFYENFYGNFGEHEKSIMEANDNQCLAIITNRPKEFNPNRIKYKIRKQYLKYYPPYGNVIHSSDSSKDSESELKLLLNEKIDNFKGVGTYYSRGGL